MDQALAEYESSSSEPNREIHCSGRLLLPPFHSTKSIPSTTPSVVVSYELVLEYEYEYELVYSLVLCILY